MLGKSQFLLLEKRSLPWIEVINGEVVDKTSKRDTKTHNTREKRIIIDSEKETIKF